MAGLFGAGIVVRGRGFATKCRRSGGSGSRQVPWRRIAEIDRLPGRSGHLTGSRRHLYTHRRARCDIDGGIEDGGIRIRMEATPAEIRRDQRAGDIGMQDGQRDDVFLRLDERLDNAIDGGAARDGAGDLGMTKV